MSRLGGLIGMFKALLFIALIYVAVFAVEDDEVHSREKRDVFIYSNYPAVVGSLDFPIFPSYGYGPSLGFSSFAFGTPYGASMIY